MIRAVVKKGRIEPVDSMPTGWADGRELVIEALDTVSKIERDELDPWSQEMNALTAILNDPTEWQQMEATLADADRHAKA